MELELSQLNKVFNPGEPNEITAVNDVSLSFQSGENVLIKGPNGSGKSTLLFLLDGRLSQTSGQVIFNGAEISDLPPYRRSQNIFRLFQDSNHGVIAMGTIAENLALAGTRGKKRSWFRPLVKKDQQDLLSRCISEYRPELSGNLSKKAFTMSPGERQGLVLSILTVQGKEQKGVLLADEPTSSLDPAMAAKCIETIASYAEQGWICISVTHDREWIESHRGRKISMQSGNVVYDSFGDPSNTL